jgi:hypothetical protein
VHPIERLRYVARASGGDQRMLVHETAGAIRGLQLEPAGLVVACRRIVERHPTSGPLWWFCSSLLTTTDPFRAAVSLASEVENDRTPDHLVDLLPDGGTVCVVGWPDLAGDALLRRGDVTVLVVDADDHATSFVRRMQRAEIETELVSPRSLAGAVLASDLVIVEAMAVGDVPGEEVLATPSSRAVASVAYCSEVPAWLVAGRGRRLPADLLRCMSERLLECEPWRADAEPVPLGLFASVVGPTGAVAVDDRDVIAAECPMAYELVKASPM